MMTFTPLDRYSFEDIDRQVAPFLQENSMRKPPAQQQELIDWIRKPSPGRLLSFIEVISLAGKYQEMPTEKKHLVPWAETALSMTRNDDNVFRLEGRCPHCGAEHALVRVYFDAPQCACLRDDRGYLYICDHCKEQLYLIRTASDGRVNKTGQRQFGKRIDDLNLSVRVHNCLKQAGIETLGELTSWTKEDLQRLRNFGSKSIVELEGVLASNGLSLHVPKE